MIDLKDHTLVWSTSRADEHGVSTNCYHCSCGTPFSWDGRENEFLEHLVNLGIQEACSKVLLDAADSIQYLGSVKSAVDYLRKLAETLRED